MPRGKKLIDKMISDQVKDIVDGKRSKRPVYIHPLDWKILQLDKFNIDDPEWNRTYTGVTLYEYVSGWRHFFTFIDNRRDSGFVLWL